MIKVAGCVPLKSGKANSMKHPAALHLCDGLTETVGKTFGKAVEETRWIAG